MTEISILIPTYNRPAYLKECLESCLCQKISQSVSTEIIITDNSDNHETAEMMQAYVAKYPSIIYHKNPVNLGMTGNRNECLSRVSGKYMIFLSDDDKLYDENSLGVLYEYLETHPNVGAASGKKVIIDDKGDERKDIEYTVIQDEIVLNQADFIKANVIGFGSTLFRFYPDIKADERTGMYADRDYNFAFIQRAPIVLLSTPVFYNRVHETNLGKVERGIRETLGWFAVMYKKNHMPFFKRTGILALRLISHTIRKIIHKLRAEKAAKIFTQFTRFMLRIKNGA